MLYFVILLLFSSYTENLTDGCWSPTRPSVFFTSRQDGVLDAWDILYQQKAPILSIKVSDEAVNCIKVNRNCLIVNLREELENFFTQKVNKEMNMNIASSCILFIPLGLHHMLCDNIHKTILHSPWFRPC